MSLWVGRVKSTATPFHIEHLIARQNDQVQGSAQSGIKTVYVGSYYDRKKKRFVFLSSG